MLRPRSLSLAMQSACHGCPHIRLLMLTSGHSGDILDSVDLAQGFWNDGSIQCPLSQLFSPATQTIVTQSHPSLTPPWPRDTPRAQAWNVLFREYVTPSSRPASHPSHWFLVPLLLILGELASTPALGISRPSPTPPSVITIDITIDINPSSPPFARNPWLLSSRRRQRRTRYDPGPSLGRRGPRHVADSCSHRTRSTETVQRRNRFVHENCSETPLSSLYSLSSPGFV